MRFKTSRRGVEARLAPAEAGLLAQCAVELLTLLGEAEEDSADPLVALVGLPAGPVPRPEDPALARLLPDGYGDDAEAAADFRRYTEVDLRAGKRANAGTVLAALQPLLGGGGRLVLDREAAGVWLSWLTDLRLVLGTRLEVSDEPAEPAAADGDETRSQLLAVYGWLGWLQESLLACVEPGDAVT